MWPPLAACIAALPKRGEVSGMATIRITPRNKGSRRLSLKTNSAKKRFLVLEVRRATQGSCALA